MLGESKKQIKIRGEGMLSVEDALNLSREEFRKMYREHMNPALGSLLTMLNFDKKFIKALGTKIWDDEGNSYLDFLGGYGSLSIGHNHPAVIEAINRVQEMPNLLQASINPLAAVLAKNLEQIIPGELMHVFFSNRGAEAVEGALKTAKIYTSKSKIVYCESAFHGKTCGALSVTGRVKYQKPFLPLIPDCQAIAFGDEQALDAALKNKDVAAFIVEPIQGEGGIISPPEGYLTRVRQLCTEYDVLFIADEVQTGLGRTGKMFACEWEEVVPDILCLAKALGGGIMPVGAFITTKEIWNKAYGSTDSATLHTSTFGGNSWAAAAGIAALQVIYDERLIEAAEEKGEYLLAKAKELQNKYPLIKDVRGKGLLIGIEFQQEDSILDKITKGKVSELTNEYTGALVAGELLNSHKVLTAYTLNNPNVIRLEPPLNVSYEQLDYLINALDEVFSKNKSFYKLAFSSTKSVLGSIFKS